MDDVLFTFNPQQFLNGLNLINQNLEKMFTNVDSFAKKTGSGFEKVTEATKKVGTETKKSIDQGFGKNAMNIVSALTKRFIALNILMKAYNTTMKYVPEIGKTFEIAGEIMMRNFFWPLRRLLIPMLQKLLTWTREHRGMFARWGAVVANIFRFVYDAVKSVIDILKGFTQSFMKNFEGIFGKTTGRLTDYMNIVVFKLTAVFAFLTELIKPIAEALGKIAAKIVYLFSELFKGLTAGLGEVSPLFSDLFGMLTNLLDLFGDMYSKGGLLAKIYYTLGMVLGTVIAPAVRAVAEIFDQLTESIQAAFRAYRIFQAWRKDDFSEIIKITAEQERANTASFQRTKDRWGKQLEGWKEGAEKWWGKMQESSETKTYKTAETRGKNKPFKASEPEKKSKRSLMPEIMKSSEIKKENKNITMSSNVNVAPITVNVHSATGREKVIKELNKAIKPALKEAIRDSINKGMAGVAGK